MGSVGVSKSSLITLSLTAAAVSYIVYTLYGMYSIFSIEECVGSSKQDCLDSFLKEEKTLSLSSFYTIGESRLTNEGQLFKLWKVDQLQVNEMIHTTINVSIPLSVRMNGSMYIHVFIHRSNQSPFNNKEVSYSSAPLTLYTPRQMTGMNLMMESSENDKSRETLPVTHWIPKVTVNIMNTLHRLHRKAIPSEILNLVSLSKDKQYYLPLLYINSMKVKVKEAVYVQREDLEKTLTLTYEPVSLGSLRLFKQVGMSMKMMTDLGFGEKDLDEVKSLMVDTNVYLLCVTIVVSMFHILFDFLAFKNDISFWRQKKTMVGLSTKTLIWRAFSSIVVLLYLHNENTSALVKIPFSMSTAIEIWKLKKAFKTSVTYSGFIPKISFGTYSSDEVKTNEIDSQAMKYLAVLLAPLCLAGAVYSLVYTPHTSWYSWCIHSLVNGVYAFGFLFMLPQLFLNYRLKSVAHLPWRALGYKAFNTFIDDLFAFIIVMPTAHRVACFRDDIVFVVYILQRYLYPVDKTRCNEFGQSYEENASNDKKSK